MGDFNRPEVNWVTMTTTKSIHHHSQLFLDAVRDAYLTQHIDEPTRYRYGQTPHILDLLLTSEDNMINNVEYHAGMGLSDHIVMTCALQVKSPHQIKAEPRLRYHKGDYQVMNAWSLFSSILNEQIKQHIPRSIPRKDKRRNIWMTREATAKHKKKQQAWKRYRQSGDRMDYIRATLEKNEFTTLT